MTPRVRTRHALVLTMIGVACGVASVVLWFQWQSSARDYDGPQIVVDTIHDWAWITAIIAIVTLVGAVLAHAVNASATLVAQQQGAPLGQFPGAPPMGTPPG